jgi:hypothetical protein
VLLLLLLLLLPNYAGEHIGDGSHPQVDIAVDPLDGTTLTAQGRSGAIAVGGSHKAGRPCGVCGEGGAGAACCASLSLSLRFLSLSLCCLLLCIMPCHCFRSSPSQSAAACTTPDRACEFQTAGA